MPVAAAAGSMDTDGSLEVGEQGVFLNEYAIGKQGDVFPEGSGRLIKAGTKINFQLHLHANGEDTPTNVALGLKFYRSHGLASQAHALYLALRPLHPFVGLSQTHREGLHAAVQLDRTV